MIELTALGKGRVVIDDHGVSRKGLLREHVLAWDDIEGYQLTIELGGGPSMFFDLNPVADLQEVIDGLRGNSTVRCGLELHGGDTTVDFDWAFDDVNLAIAHVLGRLHPRLMSAMRAQLREARALVAGDLRITKTELVWGKRETLALDEVESIELFNSSPVNLRVMKHGKTWPYAQVAMKEIANVIEVLELTRELGYPVRGIQLLDALRSAGA
jgi:hypothetical protein